MTSPTPSISSTSQRDPEKGPPPAVAASVIAAESTSPPPVHIPQWLARFYALEDRLGIEDRGITRVPDSDRVPNTPLRIANMFLMWFSINLTANNMALGFLGPVVFSLGWTDSVAILILANFAGAIVPGYIASFGPISGNRTLVVGRYTMGYWLSKLCAVLQLCGTLGFGLIDVLVCGQILSAVNGEGMTVIVGVVVASVITLFVCVVGMRVFQVYERYAFIPQLIIMSIMLGLAARHFDTQTPSSPALTPSALRGNRVSFFFLIFNVMVIWSICAGDYFVYYPASTSRLLTGLMTHLGIATSMIFVQIIGVGLVTGVAATPAWSAALDKGQGQLMVEAFAPLGGFGKFCGVLLAMGPISNNIPGIYSSAFAWQILARKTELIPRTLWSVFGVAICAVCGIVGRNALYDIFENILSLLGYWCGIFVTIHTLEEVLFRRYGFGPKIRDEKTGELKIAGYGFNWDAWWDAKRLPMGWAAGISFVVGWVGAVSCMYQVWWVGPIGKLAEGDIGVPVAAAWAALVYPGLRWVELKKFGR